MVPQKPNKKFLLLSMDSNNRDSSLSKLLMNKQHRKKINHWKQSKRRFMPLFTKKRLIRNYNCKKNCCEEGKLFYLSEWKSSSLCSTEVMLMALPQSIVTLQNKTSKP